MKYSLMTIINESDSLIDGVWMQDHTGTLETAIEKARKTEIANGNRIKVAVVEYLNCPTPNYCLKGVKGEEAQKRPL